MNETAVPSLFLDSELFQPNSALLPCLIHWAHKSWASFFSICFVASLIESGKKCIFYTAFPMAKEAILSMIPADCFVHITDETDLTQIPSDKSLLLESGNQTLLKKVIRSLEQLDEYIVFIKNVEELEVATFSIVMHHPLLVASGSVEQCIYPEILVELQRTSHILFSPASALGNITLPPLQQYEWYLESGTMKGIVSVSS